MSAGTEPAFTSLLQAFPRALDGNCFSHVTLLTGVSFPVSPACDDSGANSSVSRTTAIAVGVVVGVAGLGALVFLAMVGGRRMRQQATNLKQPSKNGQSFTYVGSICCLGALARRHARVGDLESNAPWVGCCPLSPTAR